MKLWEKKIKENLKIFDVCSFFLKISNQNQRKFRNFSSFFSFFLLFNSPAIMDGLAWLKKTLIFYKTKFREKYNKNSKDFKWVDCSEYTKTPFQLTVRVNTKISQVCSITQEKSHVKQFFFWIRRSVFQVQC